MDSLSSRQGKDSTVAAELTITNNRTLDAMKTMASAMTHDFNSILTTIVYSIELALDDISEDTLTYQDLNRVLEASVEASEYIGTIMSFCKPAKSGIADFDVQQFSETVRENIKESLPEGVEFIEECTNDPVRANADPEQLTQVIDHLIENAVQSVDQQGGRITFKVFMDRMQESDRASDPCLVLSVSDNGPGIPEEIMPKIFDPFFTTKPKGLHKGLGLSIVHSFVDNHNGVVKVSSVAGDHTTFDVFLPVIKSI